MQAYQDFQRTDYFLNETLMILDNNFVKDKTLSAKVGRDGKYTGEESEQGSANIFNSLFARNVGIINFLKSFGINTKGLNP